MIEIECKYCGAPGLQQFSFCAECWNRIIGERKEMIILVGNECGYECEHFQAAVESGILYLKWLDTREGPKSKPPEWNPNTESDDWWKK